LDKARALVAPIKEKYGIGLSWGDLFVLAGTTALRSMGAPIKEFCAGRLDDEDGTKSFLLTPSAQVSCTGDESKCPDDSIKARAAAPHEPGLIYVNPEGPLGDPDPVKSAHDIRIRFSEMTSNDRSTVALIGGGHAFGKAHGACPNGAGSSPKQVFKDGRQEIPWHGKCSTGKGKDTVTSGFEGAWTSTPTKWSNEFFKYLVDYRWEKYKGPGGHWQWRMEDNPSDQRMRLTSDIALLHDDAYKKIVTEFAQNMTALDEAFDMAWTALTTNGGTWSPNKKCDSAMPQKASMLATDSVLKE
jgi:catalase (peroxidase I)